MKGCKVDTASKFEGHLGPRYAYIYNVYICKINIHMHISICLHIYINIHIHMCKLH